MAPPNTAVLHNELCKHCWWCHAHWKVVSSVHLYLIVKQLMYLSFSKMGLWYKIHNGNILCYMGKCTLENVMQHTSYALEIHSRVYNSPNIPHIPIAHLYNIPAYNSSYIPHISIVHLYNMSYTKSLFLNGEIYSGALCFNSFVADYLQIYVHTEVYIKK